MPLVLELDQNQHGAEKLRRLFRKVTPKCPPSIVGTMKYAMRMRKKRFYTNEEKCKICTQATVPDVSVAQIAWRYVVNAIALFHGMRRKIAKPGCRF